MSAQQRYLTLVQHISKIYAANDGGIDELTDGLKDILTRINPSISADWKKVQSDSKRLLRIWHSRADDDDAAADEVVDQIADSLKEFSTGEIQLVPVIETPILVVSEIAPAPAPAPAVPVFKTVTITAIAGAEEEEEEVEEEEEEDEVIEPTDDEEEEEAEEKVEELEADAEGEAAAEEEEEEEAEEEEGMEVEKRVIRGRPYWIDINTNKLYAVIGEDDVGDEVGAIINGKSVFRAA